MKFAKELAQDLVPEWRLKYLDYKGGKKRIKEISRALAKINATPRLPRAISKGSARTPFNLFNTIEDAGIRTPPDAQETLAEQLLRAQAAGRPMPAAALLLSDEEDEEVAVEAAGRHRERTDRGHGPVNERSPLRGESSMEAAAETMTYGSILSTPAIKSESVGPPSLELPDPILSPSDPTYRTRKSLERHGEPPRVRRASTVAGDAYEVGRTHTPSKLTVGKLPKRHNIFRPRRTFSTPYGGTNSRRPFFDRLFHPHMPSTPLDRKAPLEAYREFDLAQANFFNFLDKELEKIESFYKAKEQEAEDRLEKLHEQLRIMRDRRVHELLALQRKESLSDGRNSGEHHDADDHKRRPSVLALHHSTIDASIDWLRPLEQAVGLKNGHVGKNSKALQDMVRAKQRGEDPHDTAHIGWRDYSRKPVTDDVPYRVAKRKLKMALQEYYRGLELLKSYALLNRTAFRKINKKYDKAVMARPPYRFMSEHVNKAWFVMSERLERLIVETEDLYTRYFERGNHKVAVNKLRSKSGPGEYSSAVFRNGIMLATGLILGTQGTINGFIVNFDPSDPVKGQWASYLLQLYGGYALVLLLFLLFAFDCRQWSRSKINYVFVFEFDTRHNLDWRQLAELPCLFTLFLGLTIFLNFYPTTPGVFFLWWPVLLTGLILTVLFFPVRVFYWRSRTWFLYSLWRLVFAGIYAVEFRDFFLGDMFCSLTYSMQNIEVFFCLYSQQWSNPPLCNSSNSRLLGFFSTLPGIWRALQCIRRYYDTRNIFPHLVNCGKYMCSILFYVSLSLYRIHRYPEYKILFIFFGCLNSIYVSIWDLVMDWSLCNPYAANKFLRKDLGFKSTTFYYSAMVIDPILRFNWLMYIILPVELQHSAVLSFLISVSEVFRRGMWTLIRVENEHCTNVGRFRASRDVPLPYELEEQPDESAAGNKPDATPSTPATTAGAASSPESNRVDQDQAPLSAQLQVTTSTSSQASPGLLRRRRTLPPGMLEGAGGDSPRRLTRVGTMLATAHVQDFERRKKPGGTFVAFDGVPQPNDAKAAHEDPVSSDEEEEELGAESARLIGALEQDRAQDAENDRVRALQAEDADIANEAEPTGSRAQGKAPADLDSP